MIKEAIQYIVGLGNVSTFHENGQTYSSQKLHVIENPLAAKLTVYSLSGLIEYLNSNFDGEVKLMVHVESPTEVSVFNQLNYDRKREYLIKAEALVPHFTFDKFYDSEAFNIKLQSTFVQNDDRDIMLKVVGNIKEENVRHFGDDGVSQSVTVRTGISTVGEVLVPNPVALRPYRTFLEVEQPESNFVFRMRDGGNCAIFEADGGAWKHDAMENIKKHLTFSLHEEIEAGKIVVIA